MRALARRRSPLRTLSFLALLFSGCCLSSCSLVPEYQRPGAPDEGQWPDVPKLTYDIESSSFSIQAQRVEQMTATDQTAADIGWKNFFLDERLRALIELALENNRDLRIAVTRIEQARAQYGVQVGQQFPSISATIQDVTTSLPPSMKTFGTDALSSSFLGGADLLSFQLDLFGQLRSLSEAAFQTYLASAEAGRNVRITLIAETAKAYFYLRMTELTLDVTNQTLRSRQDGYEVVQRRFAAGVASALELNQARSLIDSVVATLTQYARQRSQAVNALTYLVGRPIPADLPVAAPFTLEPLVRAIPPGLPSTLLSRRPDIRGAERRLMAANANIGAARAAFFPDISLTGLLGTNSVNLSGLFKSGAYYWSVAPNLNIPIFNGGALWANLDLAKAANREMVNQYEKSIQTAFKEVADALAGEATYGTEIQALVANQEANRKTLELSVMRYKTGIDTFLQSQIAQVSYINAQLNLITSRYNALTNRINLYVALGGGWEDTNQESVASLEVTKALTKQ